MRLQEQLDELRFNILRDTSDIIAGDTDSLWSDEALIRYIGDAERRFARQTLSIRDAVTPQTCTFKLKNGVKNYALDASVLCVISANFNNSANDLVRSGHAMIVASQPPSFNPVNPDAFAQLPPGQPIAFNTDETLVAPGGAQRVTFTVYPVPSATQDGLPMNIRVARLPLSKYTKDCLERESEILIDYQLDVLQWAAARAQRTFDGDAGAPTTAADHEAAFQAAVDRCILEAKVKMFSMIGYRYGRNGFAWER